MLDVFVKIGVCLILSECRVSDNLMAVQYLRCVRMLIQSQIAVEPSFKHAVFNVIFNNKDDHSKNFSFMMDKAGRWSLSPIYDIAYNSGMNGYHQIDVTGEAQDPTSLIKVG